MAIRRDLFLTLDGFCELFPYADMEDYDLRERLKQQCHHPLFVPQAAVLHPWRLYGPDRTYFKTRIKSQLLFYSRFPQFRPKVKPEMKGALRLWAKALLTEGPRLHYRGLARHLLRLATRNVLTLCLLLNGLDW